MRKSVLLLCLVVLLAACNDKNTLDALGNINRRGQELLSTYVSEFNMADEEIYVQKISNDKALNFLAENVPLFECPDKELEKTYYFRWWTYRKHLKETPDGYVITEFLPEVRWAGKYNAINCAVTHQFREGRWLRDSRYLKDYASFWCREKKEASKYSCPLAYSFLEYYKVTRDKSFLEKCYDDLKEVHQIWYGKRWDEEAGMFWQRDGYDGMEVSISGSLSQDYTGYRATINSYMCADAQALATIAEILGIQEDAEAYRAEADRLKDVVNTKLWDEDARFYKVIPRHGDMSFSPARELHGYIPWIFDIPGKDRADMWIHLTDTLGFKAPFGPTTAEQRADGFQVAYTGHDCQWNGPSWPFATSQTLTALARALHRFGENEYLTKETYLSTLQTYSNSHRRVNGDDRKICWIDENLDPYTGEWLSRHLLLQRENIYHERGKDYNHSTFCDLVITGLVGLQPQLDGSIVVEPLVPDGMWDYFFLTGVHYAGKEITVIYDKSGERYGLGKGLSVYVDGRKL